MFFDIASLVLLLLLALIFLPSLINPIAFAPPIPSNPSHRVWICNKLDKLKDITVCEVGCGWGGLALKLAGLPNVREVHAIELSPILAMICWLRFKLSPSRQKLRVIYGNALSKRVLSGITQDVIVLYTFKEFNAEFFPLLPPDKLVISSCFECPSTPLGVQRVGVGRIYEYVS